MKKIIQSFLGLSLLASLALNASPHSLDTSHTNVSFSVKHLMITNVKGNFKSYSGTIDFNHKTKEFNSFSAQVQTKSVDTQNKKRDDHLKSEDFFSSSKYPEMTFLMKTYTKDSEDEGVMMGDLTIKGITKKVKFEVEDIGVIKDFKGNNRVGFTLSTKINRADFGLTWNKALEFGGFAVGEKIKIIVDVEAVEK